MHARLLLPALLCLAVLAGCGVPEVRSTPVAVSAPAGVSLPATARTSVVPTPAPSNTVGEQVKVLRVKDGDSFVLADGREVRVLGIDSCELSTPGGAAAKADAERLLNGATLITLRAELGVDLDQYGRQLRYVNVYGPRGQLDFGEEMIGHVHTGIYAGKNDAASYYLDRLRRADQTGWDCAGGAAVPRAAAAVPAKPAPKAEHPSLRPHRRQHPSLRPHRRQHPSLRPHRRQHRREGAEWRLQELRCGPRCRSRAGAPRRAWLRQPAGPRRRWHRLRVSRSAYSNRASGSAATAAGSCPVWGAQLPGAGSREDSTRSSRRLRIRHRNQTDLGRRVVRQLENPQARHDRHVTPDENLHLVSVGAGCAREGDSQSTLQLGAPQVRERPAAFDRCSAATAW